VKTGTPRRLGESSLPAVADATHQVHRPDRGADAAGASAAP